MMGEMVCVCVCFFRALPCCEHSRAADKTTQEVQNSPYLLRRYILTCTLHTHKQTTQINHTNKPHTHTHTLAGDPEPVQRCIVSGFFPNAARLHYTGSYCTVRGDHTLLIHPSSILQSERSPPWYDTHSLSLPLTNCFVICHCIGWCSMR